MHFAQVQIDRRKIVKRGSLTADGIDASTGNALWFRSLARKDRRQFGRLRNARTIASTFAAARSLRY
jgi:hypothetical protein